MDPDAEVCLCFHVTGRKLLNYLRVERPRVASQLSGCGGAGTGCGWCVPFLRQLYRKATGEAAPGDLDRLTPADYARARAEYLDAGKGAPPG